MKTSTKRIPALFLLIFCIFSLLAGCTISNVSIYQSCATIYISNTESAESLVISSSDLVSSQSLEATIAVLLQSESIRAEIDQSFPNTEYELTLELPEDSMIYKVIATGENSENLAEICNMATLLLCEKLNTVMDCSCRIINSASHPTLSVAAN